MLCVYIYIYLYIFYRLKSIVAQSLKMSIHFQKI